MKVKDFIDFLKENIRKDDLSHLNDDLAANKKNEARWPSDDDDDYEYEDDETKDYGDYDDWYDDDNYEPKKSSNPKFDKDDDYYEDDDQDDDIEHLNYLLRRMFKNAGIDDVRISSHKDIDIVIECHVPKENTLREVIRVFEVANKLKRDILAQYDSEFDVWQSKDKGILSFGFTLSDGLEDDSFPF